MRTIKSIQWIVIFFIVSSNVFGQSVQTNNDTITRLVTLNAGDSLINNGVLTRGVSGNNAYLNNNGKINKLSMTNGVVVNTGTISGNITITGGELFNYGTIDGDIHISDRTNSIISGTVTGEVFVIKTTDTVETNIRITGTIENGLSVANGLVIIDSGAIINAPITLSGLGKLHVKSGATIDLTDASMDPNVSLILDEGVNLIGQYYGILTFKKTLSPDKWNFIGFPIEGDSITHRIGIAPLATASSNIWALRYDYDSNQWDGNYLHWNNNARDSIEVGEGIFTWTEDFTTIDITGRLVHRDVTITKQITGTDSTGRWLILANPYQFNIGINHVGANTQGEGVYLWNGSDYVFTPANATNDKISGGNGFIVNMPEGHNTYTFNYNALYSPAKGTTGKRDFLTVSVSTDGYKVPVMFAKNEAATTEYDIFDANKMFGDGSVAEPYLICNDIDLCKEEVNALPYTATMNIKSGEARSIDIIAENIPEGYTLTLIDNEEEIVMNQGDTYTVEIASGENADRFKLKIGEKNVSITDVEVAEALSIRNNNRNIIIEGGKNIKAEVYNTLGQKVYETTKRNFALEGVEAGAYVVKVQSGNAVQSHKMIIR